MQVAPYAQGEDWHSSISKGKENSRDLEKQVLNEKKAQQVAN